LVTRHSKHVVVVNTHEITSQARPVGRQMQVAICAGRIEPSTSKAGTSKDRQTKNEFTRINTNEEKLLSKDQLVRPLAGQPKGTPVCCLNLCSFVSIRG
jgi:hypothetical protein